MKIFCSIVINLFYYLGGVSDYDNTRRVERYNEELDEWEEVAYTRRSVKQVVVSYRPCVPDKCDNFPF